MPTFEKTIFTNQGISFLNDLNSGRIKLVNATAIYSTSDLSGMSDDDIRNMTDIQNKDISVPCDIVKLDNHQTKIRSIANNEKLSSGIYIRSYATFFTDDQGNQSLFAIKVNTKPQYLVGFDGVNTNSQSYGFNIGISQTDNIQFTKLSNLNATVQDIQDVYDSIQHFKVREIANTDDFWGLPVGIYICQGETPAHNPYNAPLWGVAISYGKTIQYFNKDGNAWIITPDNGGWERLAKEEYVDSAIGQVTSSLNSLTTSLGNFSVREMTDNDDFWGLAPGIYTSDGQNPKHNPYNAPLYGVAVSYGKTIQYFNKDGVPWIITPNNGGWARNDGFPVREMTDNDDFWGLKPGIYICQGEFPAHNPYNNKIWGTAVSFGKTIQFFNKDGEEWIITPDNGGWERLAKRGYVDSAVNSVADNLNSQVSGFNSVIAVNQSSAIANASNAWAQIRYNGSDISNLKSQTASNATRIFNAENRLNANDTKIGQLSQYRTTYSGNILNMYSLADGLYWLTGDNYNGPIDKMWANALVSHINPYDTMIVIISGTNVYMNMTSNNSWIGWNRFMGQNEFNTLQNQINAIKSKIGM